MSDRELTYGEHTKAKDFLKMGQDDLKSGLDKLVDFPEDEFKKAEPGKCEAFGSKEQLRGTKEEMHRFTFKHGEEVFYPGFDDEKLKDDVADSTVNDIIKSAFTHTEYVGWLKGNILEHRLLAGKNGSYIDGMAQADKYQYYYDEYVRENTP